MLVFQHAPGKWALQVAPGVTTWVVIASDGTTYATVAALLAAGKTPYPKSDGVHGLDLGMKVQSLTLSTVNAGAAGSAFYVAYNPQTQPSGTAAELVQPGGVYFVEPGNISQLWVALTASGDTLDALLRY